MSLRRQLEMKIYFINNLIAEICDLVEEYHTSGVYENQEMNQFIQEIEGNTVKKLYEKLKSITEELACEQMKRS